MAKKDSTKAVTTRVYKAGAHKEYFDMVAEVERGLAALNLFARTGVIDTGLIRGLSKRDLYGFCVELPSVRIYQLLPLMRADVLNFGSEHPAYRLEHVVVDKRGDWAAEVAFRDELRALPPIEVGDHMAGRVVRDRKAWAARELSPWEDADENPAPKAQLDTGYALAIAELEALLLLGLSKPRAIAARRLIGAYKHLDRPHAQSVSIVLIDMLDYHAPERPWICDAQRRAEVAGLRGSAVYFCGPPIEVFDEHY